MNGAPHSPFRPQDRVFLPGMGRYALLVRVEAEAPGGERGWRCALLGEPPGVVVAGEGEMEPADRGQVRRAVGAGVGR